MKTYLNKALVMMKGIIAVIVTLVSVAYKRVKAFILKQRMTLHVSPITKWWANRILLKAIERTALYGLARKARRAPVEPIFPHNPIDDPIKRAFTSGFKGILNTIFIGGDLYYLSAPAGWGHVNPWPDPFIRYSVEARAKMLEQGMDGIIVDRIVAQTKATERVTFKKCLTKEVLDKSINGLSYSLPPPLSDEYFYDDKQCYSGKHIICVTQKARIETDAFTRDGLGDWEDEMSYQDYIDRKLYPGEYGRLKLHDGFYIVFIISLDERMQHSILFGPDAITVTPLKKNLKALFRRTPAGEAGRQPRGFDVGFEMNIGAVADLSKCVVLEATRRVGKK